MKRIDNEATVRIVQKSQVNWEIQTRSGHVLVPNITLSRPSDAEIYVKGYISSFQCWNYEVVPIVKDKK